MPATPPAIVKRPTRIGTRARASVPKVKASASPARDSVVRRSSRQSTMPKTKIRTTSASGSPMNSARCRSRSLTSVNAWLSGRLPVAMIARLSEWTRSRTLSYSFWASSNSPRRVTVAKARRPSRETKFGLVSTRSTRGSSRSGASAASTARPKAGSVALRFGSFAVKMSWNVAAEPRAGSSSRISW